MILDMVLMKSCLEGSGLYEPTVGCASADDALHNSSRPNADRYFAEERLDESGGYTSKEFCSLD